MAGAKALKKKSLQLAQPNQQPRALPYAQTYNMRAFGVPSNATNFFSAHMPVAAAVPVRWEERVALAP